MENSKFRDFMSLFPFVAFVFIVFSVIIMVDYFDRNVNPDYSDNRFQVVSTETISINETITILVDTNTGVKYLSLNSNGTRTLTVMVDAEGKPLIEKDDDTL